MLSKNKFLSLLLFTTTNLLTASQEQPNSLLIFNNPYINSLDGVNFMIDGVAIRNILAVLKKLMYIKEGQKVDTKIIGSYVFENQKLSIKQLVELENQNPSDPRLADILKVAKKDFIETNKPFIKNLEPVKKLMLSLIQEFCERRNRKDSIILNWAQARSGGEAELFNRSVQNFATFDAFLQDLILFLKDLVNSCPRAREQYKEWYKHNRLSMEL